MEVFRFMKTKVLLTLLLALPMLTFAENPGSPKKSSEYDNRQLHKEDENHRMQYDHPNYRYSSSGYYESCEEPEECCERNGFWDCVKVPLIGIAAGIGGGIIGAEIIDHKGDRGPAGPPGSFTPDTGQTLTFSLTALFPAIPPGTVIARPFVTAPDGLTVEGAPVVTPTGGGTILFKPIVIPNPVFGFYNFGLDISNTSTSTLTGITLNGTLVTASRDGSVTSELTPIAGVSIAPGESQISSTYTYGPANVP